MKFFANGKLVQTEKFFDPKTDEQECKLLNIQYTYMPFPRKLNEVRLSAIALFYNGNSIKFPFLFFLKLKKINA